MKGLVYLLTLSSIGFAAMIGSFDANAIELYNYKSSSSNKIVKMTENQVTKIWGSDTPACIKDGAKLLGVNKAFRAKGLGYRDCSSSEKAQEKQRMLGYKVEKIDFTSLPDSVAEGVTGE